MALSVTYIGEDVAASGFALAGVRVHRVAADAERVWPLFEEARAGSDLVILNRAHADCVADALRAALLHEPVPPVVVLPSMDMREQPSSEAVRRARRVLGLAASESVDDEESLS
jgi:vacuolar-type H+-ATPase subunit F/Vma7